MVKSDQDDKKIRGFAVLINSILLPLNENTKFREKFREIDVKILLNASNLNHAAILIIEKGRIRVESIPNKPKENLKKKKVGWNAFVEMDTQTFLTIVLNRLSIFEIARMWITRSIKIRGIRKLLTLLKVIQFLTNNSE